MYTIKGNAITLTRGDSFYCQIALKKDGEAYIPQEGDVIRFGMKKSPFDTECLVTKVIPNDSLLLYLEPDDTKQLQFGVYYYDIELTFANQDKDTFINNETFTLATEIV